MHLREATSADAEFLYDMLLEAFDWDGTGRFTREQMLAEEHTSRYLGGWKRPEDFGIIALSESTPVGAVWARALPADAAGYGYVADDVPEIGMGVAKGHRGTGLGGELLTALIGKARELGRRALSLSVEDGNGRARRLYERCGFVVVGRNGGSDTMLREL